MFFSVAIPLLFRAVAENILFSELATKRLNMTKLSDFLGYQQVILYPNILKEKFFHVLTNDLKSEVRKVSYTGSQSVSNKITSLTRIVIY